MCLLCEIFPFYFDSIVKYFRTKTFIYLDLRICETFVYCVHNFTTVGVLRILHIVLVVNVLGKFRIPRVFFFFVDHVVFKMNIFVSISSRVGNFVLLCLFGFCMSSYKYTYLFSQCFFFSMHFY